MNEPFGKLPKEIHMEYANAQNQVGAGMINRNPVARDQPRIQALCNMLEKTLHGCHEIAVSIENAASRIAGAEPEKNVTPGTAPAPVASSLEQRLHEMVALAEALSNRLARATSRIDSAV